MKYKVIQRLSYSEGEFEFPTMAGASEFIKILIDRKTGGDQMEITIEGVEEGENDEE